MESMAIVMTEDSRSDQDGSKSEQWLDLRYLKVELMRFADRLNMAF